MRVKFGLSGVGDIGAEVLDESTFQYRIKINDDDFWVDKHLCEDLNTSDELKNIVFGNDDIEINEPLLNLDDVIQKNKVERVDDMNLKDKVLSKLDYSKIARKVYDLLEDDIAEKVFENIDESEIAKSLAKEHSESFIELVEDTILEAVLDEITFETIESEFNELVYSEVR